MGQARVQVILNGRQPELLGGVCLVNQQVLLAHVDGFV